MGPVGCSKLGAVIAVIACLGCGERRAEACTDSEFFCVGSTRHYCVDHHTETKYIDTEECGPDKVCVMTKMGWNPWPMCALRAQPDPRCPSGNYMSFCDGNTLTACSWDYVTAVLDCGAEECRPDPDYPSEDVDCADPQSACYDRKLGWWCEGDEAIQCTNQTETERTACEDCVKDGMDVICN